MEEKLKKQRRRIIIRITLILTAVWLTVSGVFCVITLISTKNDIQTREFELLTNSKKIYTIESGNNDISEHLYIADPVSYDSPIKLDRDWNGQVVLLDTYNQKVFDTTESIMAQFGISTQSGRYYVMLGYINYKSLMESLYPSQIKEITALLEQKAEKDKSYELSCTKFFVRGGEIIPSELSVILCDKNNIWFVEDEVIKTFKTSASSFKGEKTLRNDDMHRNIIPKDYFINGPYNTDYMSNFSNKQKEHVTDMFFTSPFECYFYSSDYVALSDYIYTDDSGSPVFVTNTYVIRYAKNINLLDYCGKDLMMGILLIFVFFSVIGSMLCFMIWKMVSSQIIQEQKRTELTNALAHDIKTPLFVISGYAYILKEDTDQSERCDYLDKIIEQTDQINGLVHRMLELSKLDSYKMTLNKCPVDLSQLAAELLGNYKKLPENRTISFSHDPDSTVSADPELLKTAFQNLIDNAVKYSPADSEINVSVSNKRFSVSNKSEPLSKAELRQIWKPFVRKDKSRHKKGNGLGLSIVWSIAELHGAKCEASYKDGIFTIIIDFGK